MATQKRDPQNKEMHGCPPPLPHDDKEHEQKKAIPTKKRHPLQSLSLNSLPVGKLKQRSSSKNGSDADQTVRSCSYMCITLSNLNLFRAFPYLYNG
eukprot:scaffold368918_cov63-Attheya_sp.AAC.2